MIHARKIYIPAHMKALLTPELLGGVHQFFQVPVDVRGHRLDRPHDAGLSLILFHPTFPDYATEADVPEECWDLLPD